METTKKKTVAIGMAGARVMLPGIWSSPMFTPGSFRDLNPLVEKLRAKTDAVSGFLNDRMDPATKECLDSYRPASGDSNKLRAILADHFNKVISGDSICDIPGFQTIRLKPTTEELRSQNPQGQGLSRLNRLVLEEVYYKELWWSRSWQPNAELCHPCHGLQIDRFEIIHDTKFTDVATEIANQVSFVSPTTTFAYHTIDWEDPWDFEKVYIALEDWANGYPFDDDQERYLVHMVKGSFVQQICMFALAKSHDIPGILVHNSPPEEAAPHGKVSLVDLDLSKFDRIADRIQSRQKDAVSVLKKHIPTRNESYNRLIDKIVKVAVKTTKPILLLGPTGAGKSELANHIFELRKERNLVSGDAPVTVDCTTIRGDGAMSALFGHVAGAFTGATNDRDGFVLTAHKGLLFLDEIGDLGIEEQGLLLRALETKHFRPLGADKEKESDFQLIAATNRDLWAAVRSGAFRKDLWARINHWCYELPRLRDRAEDIEPNLDYELKRWARENGRRVRMNSEVKARFLRFATSPEAKWIANFRDLSGIVDRMATQDENGKITLDILESEINDLKQQWAREEGPGEGSDAILRSVMAEDRLAELDLIDRIQLSAVIPICRESRSAAAAAGKLFAASLAKKTGAKKKNASARMTSYLKQFKLTFDECAGRS